jgi:hypothetical protein
MQYANNNNHHHHQYNYMYSDGSEEEVDSEG